MTFQELFDYEKGSPHIALLHKKYGNEFEIVLNGMLISFTSQYNIERTLSAEQAISITRQLIREYPIYKLSDFAKFFSEASTGKWGKAFGRLDMETIFEMIRSYDLERIEAMEQWHRERKESATFEKPILDDAVEIPEEALKQLRKLLMKLNEGKKKINAEPIRKADPVQELANKYIRMEREYLIASDKPRHVSKRDFELQFGKLEEWVNKKLISQAHQRLTKGNREKAPTAEELQVEINKMIEDQQTIC